MKSSKRHVILLSLIFLLKCLSKSFFIINYETPINMPLKKDALLDGA